MLFQHFDALSLLSQLLSIRLVLLIDHFGHLLRVSECLFLQLFEFLTLFGKLGLKSLSPFTLRLVGLLVLEYFTLTFVNNLEEKVLHKTHGLLILLQAE